MAEESSFDICCNAPNNKYELDQIYEVKRFFFDKIQGIDNIILSQPIITNPRSDPAPPHFFRSHHSSIKKNYMKPLQQDYKAHTEHILRADDNINENHLAPLWNCIDNTWLGWSPLLTTWRPLGTAWKLLDNTWDHLGTRSQHFSFTWNNPDGDNLNKTLEQQ